MGIEQPSTEKERDEKIERLRSMFENVFGEKDVVESHFGGQDSKDEVVASYPERAVSTFSNDKENIDIQVRDWVSVTKDRSPEEIIDRLQEMISVRKKMT